MAIPKSTRVTFWGALVLAVGIALAGYAGYNMFFADYVPNCNGKPMKPEDSCFELGRRGRAHWDTYEEQRAQHQKSMPWALGFGMLLVAGGIFLLYDGLRPEGKSAPKKQPARRDPVEY